MVEKSIVEEKGRVDEGGGVKMRYVVEEVRRERSRTERVRLSIKGIGTERGREDEWGGVKGV